MLQQSLTYNRLADQKLIEIFETETTYGEKEVALFSHILNAQHIWTHRILQQVPQFDRLQVHPAENFSGISDDNARALDYILNTMPLDQTIHYAIADGSKYMNTVEQILFHVVNHSTYHRGQIASQLKLNGITPPVTDFVALSRSFVL
jgi:uncharacterized damage-inducible protein DinB